MADPEVLRSDLESLEHPVFAVLDGAQFDNLPDALFDGDFVHKPLYLDRGDGNRDQTATAPQLVWLDRDAQTAPQHEDAPALDILDRLFDLIGDKPAAVFWECPGGGEVLYKHLRRINMVLVPNLRDGGFEPQDDQVQQQTYEQVLFRHADANVMAQVLPTLNEYQFARLFKPATMIMFVPDDDWAIGSPIMMAPRPDNLPDAPSGLLKLEHPQIQFMGNARKMRSHDRIAKFLRKTAPVQTKHMSDPELRSRVAHYDNQGREFGITHERASGRFAWLMLASDDQFLKQPEVKDYLRKGPHEPNRRMDLLAEAMAEAAGSG